MNISNLYVYIVYFGVNQDVCECFAALQVLTSNLYVIYSPVNAQSCTNISDTLSTASLYRNLYQFRLNV